MVRSETIALSGFRTQRSIRRILSTWQSSPLSANYSPQAKQRNQKSFTIVIRQEALRKRGKLKAKSKCEDSCRSCGVAWHDHLGISGTCSKLEFARTALQIIRTWAAFPLGIQITSELKEIRDMCDKTLESIRDPKAKKLKIEIIDDTKPKKGKSNGR